jgi:deoxyribonuclease-4
MKSTKSTILLKLKDNASNNNKLFIGCHINIKWGFASSSEFLNGIGGNFFQIYLSSPKSYHRSKRSDAELEILKRDIQKYNQKIVIHGSLILNFCNPEDDYRHYKGLSLLIEDLKESVKLGALGVVIHMGKKLKMDQKVAINNYVKGLKTVLKKTPNNSTIILETGAGCGSEVCTQIFDLKELYEKFTPKEQQRIMFCIDTCHVFAAGYDLSNEQYVEIFDKLIDNTLSWKKIACIHLNDSDKPLDSHKDRHADIGKGFIGGTGLKKFVQLCYQKNVPLVLETPCNKEDKKKEIQLVKDWIADLNK